MELKYFDCFGKLKDKSIDCWGKVESNLDIFDEESYIKDEVFKEICFILDKNNNFFFTFESDVVSLYYANKFAGSTHGNYSPEILFTRSR